MRCRLLALDEEKAWWILNLMVAITDAYNKQKPLMIENEDARHISNRATIATTGIL
jgi:hypothetical protein